MLDDAQAALDVVRLIAGGALVTIGIVFLIGGAIGMLRFPDLYTRLHAAGAGDAVGAVITIAGLAVASNDWRIALKLALLAGLIIAMASTLSQLIANAAHAAGLAPLAGPYTAPRPGASRRKEPDA